MLIEAIARSEAEKLGENCEHYGSATPFHKGFSYDVMRTRTQQPFHLVQTFTSSHPAESVKPGSIPPAGIELATPTPGNR